MRFGTNEEADSLVHGYLDNADVKRRIDGLYRKGRTRLEKMADLRRGNHLALEEFPSSQEQSHHQAPPNLIDEERKGGNEPAADELPEPNKSHPGAEDQLAALKANEEAKNIQAAQQLKATNEDNESDEIDDVNFSDMDEREIPEEDSVVDPDCDFKREFDF